MAGGSMKAFSVAWAAVALCATLSALATSITGSVDPGVVGEEVGGVILDVTPGGIAWQVGIRPGQRVAALHRADEPDGWALETIDAAGNGRGISAAGMDAPIRATVPLALAAVVAAAIAIASIRWSARRAELLAAVAMLFAGAPFGVVPASAGGSVVLFLAAMGPPVWLARWQFGSSHRALAALAAFAAISVATLGANVLQPLGAAAAAQTWAAVVAVLALVTVGVGMGLTRDRLLHAFDAVRVVDIAILVVAAAATVGLAAAELHPAVIVVVIGLPLLGYGRARTAIAALVDRAILSELREREAIRASEEERARVSREIHDDPLQAIAGVIQQLEQPEPDAAAARDSLRSVAARLRGVATELHPPVLDDLGLVPAIEAGARLITRVAVVQQIDNHTGYTAAERPPPDVELAVYRIVQEAVLNAERHSGGAAVVVVGSVARDRIRLEITDNGTGISDATIDASIRAGHLGVSSMRRRAAAIGAHLEIGAQAAGGTRVSLRWPE